MPLVIRLHPLLRDQLQTISGNRNSYRFLVAGLVRDVSRIVVKHGSSIGYAAIYFSGERCAKHGSAMSARRGKNGQVIVDIDPIGTAIVSGVHRWTERDEEVWSRRGRARHTR